MENIPKVRITSPPVLEAKDSYYHFRQGNDLYNSKDYQKALESYDKAIAIKPDYHQAWNNRGISLRKLERYEEAIESYDKAIAIKPDYHKAWHNRVISRNRDLQQIIKLPGMILLMLLLRGCLESWKYRILR